MQHTNETLSTYVWNTWKHTLATCMLCNISIYFCNIQMKHLKHIFETPKTYACNLKHTFVTCVYSHCNIRNIQMKHLKTYVWNIWNTISPAATAYVVGKCGSQQAALGCSGEGEWRQPGRCDGECCARGVAVDHTTSAWSGAHSATPTAKGSHSSPRGKPRNHLAAANGGVYALAISGAV
jgi:hypothetical protein